MSAFFRRRVEDTIERMIRLLDDLDADADLEPEPVEEQHDTEVGEVPPVSVIIAANALKNRT